MKSTAHIKPEGNPIAETILLPGDPLRAKFIADNYLDDVVQFNTVRNMLGYTGKYNGKEVSVMGTGMGVPSMGIYSYELIHFFGVKNLIRIGSCGALQDNLDLYDIVVAMGSSTNSNYADQYDLPGTFSATASWDLLKKTDRIAEEKGYKINVGNVLSSDVFYNADKEAVHKWKKAGVLGIEMESTALYMNANFANVNALCILTVSDHVFTQEETTPEERQNSFTKMMDIALELAAEL